MEMIYRLEIECCNLPKKALGIDCERTSELLVRVAEFTGLLSVHQVQFMRRGEVCQTELEV